MLENNNIDPALKVEVKAEHLSTFSLAAQQNSYPLFRSINLRCFSNRTCEPSHTKKLNQLVVTVTSEPEILSPEKWFIDEICVDQMVLLQNRPLCPSYGFLSKLTEEIEVSVTVTVHIDNEACDLLTSKVLSIAVLPYNFWGGESRQPELLAAFVKPNGLYVESLVRQVTEMLEKEGYGRRADGYQSNTRETPFFMVAALWNIVFEQRIAYVTPPQSFARVGQRIRLPADISSSKIAACLDLSVLFASCLELMGLNSVVALADEHAFVGVWLIDENFPVLTNDDPMDLRKRVDARDLVLFETTLVTNDSPVTFEQAREHARNYICEDKEDTFVYLIDIKQARARNIRSLATAEEKIEEKNSTLATQLAYPIIPPLPPVKLDEQVKVETPETRIDSWQRKLLDLTKRNPLLSLKERTVSIKIYCPAIESMEDQLADGVLFKFLSSEESPLSTEGRSPDVFRLQTGLEIHKQYALKQLDTNVLLANMSKKKLETTSVALFRKAKNDLEEGGSNTLYFALGMLTLTMHKIMR